MPTLLKELVPRLAAAVDHPRGGRPHGRQPLLHRRLRLGTQIRLRASEAPTTGFRGFTLSLTVSQPATVNSLIDAALDAGATPLKPAAKSLWGYGGVVQAPDGTIWKVATSAKKDTGPATRQIDEIVLLLGVADVAASKRFYVDHGLAVAKSFGRMYVEFAAGSGPVKLALYRRRALAKDAGVSPDGTGSHRLMIGGDAGPFTDPDEPWRVSGDNATVAGEAALLLARLSVAELRFSGAGTSLDRDCALGVGVSVPPGAAVGHDVDGVGPSAPPRRASAPVVAAVVPSLVNRDRRHRWRTGRRTRRPGPGGRRAVARAPGVAEGDRQRAARGVVEDVAHGFDLHAAVGRCLRAGS